MSDDVPTIGRIECKTPNGEKKLNYSEWWMVWNGEKIGWKEKQSNSSSFVAENEGRKSKKKKLLKYTIH